MVHLPGMKTKQIKMDPELARAMKNQLRAFKKKFGREPGPNDPVFFDPDADTPQPGALPDCGEAKPDEQSAFPH